MALSRRSLQQVSPLVSRLFPSTWSDAWIPQASLHLTSSAYGERFAVAPPVFAVEEGCPSSSSFTEANNLFLSQKPRHWEGDSFRCQHSVFSPFPSHSRAFSAFASTALEEAGSSSSVPSALLDSEVVPKARRRKNLFDLLWRIPNWGVGGKFAKRHWGDGTFYEVTQIRLNKTGRTGAAWGVFYQNGEPASPVTKIGGVNKPCWKQVKAELAVARSENPAAVAKDTNQ